MAQWLADLRGARVSLRVAQRGDKKDLALTVQRNAAEALAQHRLKRASDLTARSAALVEVAETLGMDSAPLRIECIDISHVQGTNVVASLVVFEDGLPKRSDYRRFAIREKPGDDVASIAEVVRRRFTHGVTGKVADLESEFTADEGSTDPGGPSRRRRRHAGDRPGYRAGAPVRLSAATAGRRRWCPAGQRRRGGADRSADHRCHRLRVWPNGSRRSGCRAKTTRSSSRAPARRCTCCNGCATRLTGSPSPTTGRNGRSR